MHAMLQSSFFLIDLPYTKSESKDFSKPTYSRENSQHYKEEKMDDLSQELLCTGGSRLMRISLMRISLLRFYKTFHKYLPYANFGLLISLVQFFGQYIWLMRFFGY